MKKYIYILSLVFLCVSSIADAGNLLYKRGGHSQDYYRKYGIDPSSLVGWYSQGDRRSSVSTQTWTDLSAQSNDIEQITAGSQPTVVSGRGGYRDFDGVADYLYQKVLDDQTGATFWPTNAGAAFNAGNARFRVAGVNIAAAFASATKDYVAIVTDDAGVRSYGYIGAADSAEALGSDIFVGWDFTDPWGILGTCTINDANTFTSTGNAGVTKTGILTVGKAYKLVITGSTASTRTELRNSDNTVIYRSTDIFAGGGTTTYFTAQNVDGIYLRNTDTGQTDVTSLQLYEVTNVGSDGVLIYDDRAGSNQSWTFIGTGFKYNTPTSFQIVKSDFHAIKTAMSVSMWVKPDDGQPAAAQVLIGQWRAANELRKWNITLETSGKLTANGSSNGAANSENKLTDAAVFPNEATSWTHLTAVYNGTTWLWYVNGALVASTAGVGGIPASLWTSPVLFAIGASSTPASYFAGLKDDIHVHNVALTATQIKQIFDSERNKNRP